MKILRNYENVKKRDFIFAYFAGLDGIQHLYTKSSKETKNKLDYYSKKLSKLFNILEKEYGANYEVAIFSDHGMTSLTDTVDLKKDISSLNLIEGKDYLSFLDSTMARFWYHNQNAKQVIRELLNRNKVGHFVSDEDKKAWGIDFSDNRYGDDIFLINPGVQIAPSDMGRDALPGMHGYTPDDKDSNALWMSTFKPTSYPKEVLNIFDCMKEKIEELSDGS